MKIGRMWRQDFRIVKRESERERGNDWREKGEGEGERDNKKREGGEMRECGSVEERKKILGK